MPVKSNIEKQYEGTQDIKKMDAVISKRFEDGLAKEVGASIAKDILDDDKRHSISVTTEKVGTKDEVVILRV
jgi:hypothetical protein